MSAEYRRLTPPLGWPINFRIVTVTPADRHPLIGISFRLPDDITENRINPNMGKRHGHHRALSIVWSKPARWWKR